MVAFLFGLFKYDSNPKVRHKIIWNDFEQHCFTMLAQRAEGRMPRVNRHDADLGVACKATGRARATRMLRVHPLGDAILKNPVLPSFCISIPPTICQHVHVIK